VQFSGAATTEPVGLYAGIGPAGNQFGGQFLRNATGSVSVAQTPTTLTLTGLPVHSTLTLRFLLAAIDTWDGDFSAPGAPVPDYFNVTVDGGSVFRQTLSNYRDNVQQSYTPPPGVQLLSRPFPELGWQVRPTNGGGFPDFGDAAYNLGADPAFANIPHTASSVTIRWFADGSGWQGGDDESWAIDRVAVSVNSDSVLAVPFAGAEALGLRAPTPTAMEDPLRLDFSLPVAGNARLEIFDLAGRALWNRDLPGTSAGAHEIIWDGRSARDGRRVVGVCFIRLRAALGARTTRAVRLP
jgi:hypothetical protein